MHETWHTQCRQLLEATRKSLAWINDPGNEATVGLERKAIDKRLRRLITETAKLDRSIEKPMCVGIFGPSQAGKSYLVSVLASGSGRSLQARFAGLPSPLDFLQDINPGGERESTGVVTRFSRHEKASPEGFPVCLRLLSETDIVKVLGNTFFLDGDPKTSPQIEPEEVRRALAGARERMQGSRPADNTLTVDDIWDVQEYFERTFEGSRALEGLRGFWDEASEIVPQLALADRAELFALLWGRLPQFTGIYSELVGALARLGFAQDAFCPIEALVPRSESIIDVQTLAGLGKPGQPELLIRSAAGAPVALPRPIVTALVAELHIAMAAQPWPFLSHTDLLDFPGARSRQRLALTEFLKDEAKNPLKETVLRGKVAYLFERYVAEQELTCMLLCVKPSNQDVTDLPDMINRWVGITHGSTPAQRLGKSVALYLVLTWFDEHFKEKAGDEKAHPGERFKNRLLSSIESFFAKTHEWPTQWTPGRAFDNVYWFRNPTVAAESIIEYGETLSELRFRPDRIDYIERLRRGYLDVPSVQRFFRDPGRAFDEGLKLNDGGATYLATNLEGLCKPAVKIEQIAARLAALGEQLSSAIDHFYISNDVEVRLAERRAVSFLILQHVQRLYAEGRFADLLSALQISQHGYSELLYDFYTRRSREKKKEEGMSPLAVAGIGRPLPGLPPLPGMPPLPGTPPFPGTPPLPGSTAPAPSGWMGAGNGINLGLARAAVEYWMNLLRSSGESEALSGFFLGDAKIAAELVNELSQAARRSALETQVAAAIDKLAGNISEEIDVTLEKAAFACSAIINRFVTRFYFEAMAPALRPLAPTADRGEKIVFTRPPGANSARQIDLEPSHHQFDALSHWMYGFHRLVEDNARSVDGLTLDVERNAALGAILKSIQVLRAQGSEVN
ncbi:virulence factor SrfC family protein [Ancylobacter sp. IITR112]|uniref:virulence factor SrfC family protein n=1 Tax=Ancylobacter sp. IITR112 TaxID=3138073 RepID=UPI00352BB5D9